MTVQVLTHTTVLLQEAVELLNMQSDGCYVDGTFGRGGHSRLILQQLSNKGRLIAFDKDPQAIEEANRLVLEDNRFSIIQNSFADIAAQINKCSLNDKVNGVLLDLGVSSPQLDEAERGFSFNQNGPLDMRMDPSKGISVAQWIATATEQEIARVFKEYGEERFAKRMACAIVKRRDIKPFEQTLDLAEVIAAANPAWEKGKHPATRAFQAMRIEVNNELNDLRKGLQDALAILAPNGRLVVISFHSLEDRIVKHFMRLQTKGEIDNLPRNLPIQVEPFKAKYRLVGKPVYASESELKNNPRSRSAVLRVLEKL